jgi:winged helix-turn-helix protein
MPRRVSWPRRTGTAERYVREWLEQQAVAGFLRVDDPDADANARLYRLPPEYEPVFVDADAPPGARRPGAAAR